jgi:hypothetical protein
LPLLLVPLYPRATPGQHRAIATMAEDQLPSSQLQPLRNWTGNTLTCQQDRPPLISWIACADCQSALTLKASSLSRVRQASVLLTVMVKAFLSVMAMAMQLGQRGAMSMNETLCRRLSKMRSMSALLRPELTRSNRASTSLMTLAQTFLRLALTGISSSGLCLNRVPLLTANLPALRSTRASTRNQPASIATKPFSLNLPSILAT